MKAKKIMISFILSIFILQYGFGIVSNANKESERVILNDIIENKSEDKSEDSSCSLEHIKNDEELKMYSESAILIEAETGKVLYDKDMHVRKYPASTTKILTAILAIENCNLNDVATASHSSIFSVKSGYTVANIQEGESFTIRELLDVLMLQSANEAANVIAEHISGSINEFTNLMNQKAKEIGCLDSNFVNTNGAHNENHYSTAYDLALIAKYCMKNDVFRQLVTKESCSLPQTEIYQEERVFRNTNSLMNKESKYYYPYCNGIKTGFTTPAKNCLISSSNKDGFELISVILHAETTEEGQSARYVDTINLFEYGYNNFNKDEIWEEYGLNEEISSIVEQSDKSNMVANNMESIIDNQEELIEEHKIETVGAIKKEYNIVEKNNDYKEWIKIFSGILIILYLIKYYKTKSKVAVNEVVKIRESASNNSDNIYNFKIN